MTSVWRSDLDHEDLDLNFKHRVGGCEATVLIDDLLCFDF